MKIRPAHHAGKRPSAPARSGAWAEAAAKLRQPGPEAKSASLKRRGSHRSGPGPAYLHALTLQAAGGGRLRDLSSSRGFEAANASGTANEPQRPFKRSAARRMRPGVGRGSEVDAQSKLAAQAPHSPIRTCHRSSFEPGSEPRGSHPRSSHPGPVGDSDAAGLSRRSALLCLGNNLWQMLKVPIAAAAR